MEVEPTSSQGPSAFCASTHTKLCEQQKVLPQALNSLKILKGHLMEAAHCYSTHTHTFFINEVTHHIPHSVRIWNLAATRQGCEVS